MRLPLVWDWPIVSFSLLSNKTAGFFDYQYLWKESSNLSFFAWRYYCKVPPETPTFWLAVAWLVSHPIKWKVSLIINKTGKNQLMSLIFSIEIIIKERLHLRQLVGYSQVCLWTNHIPGFFDHQYIWKEITDAFVSSWSIFFIYLFDIYIFY